MAYWVNGVKKTDHLQLIADSNALDDSYIEGNESVVAFRLDAKFTSTLTNFRCFPNLKNFVILNTERVVDIDDATFTGTKMFTEGTFYVANHLLTDWQTAHPSWNIATWTFQNEFEIPYIEGLSTTLTAEYIDQVISMAGGQATAATKIVIPSGFTEYESGVLDYLFSKFPNVISLETYGVTLITVVNNMPNRMAGDGLDTLIVHSDSWGSFNVQLVIKTRKMVWQTIEGFASQWPDGRGYISSQSRINEVNFIDFDKKPFNTSSSYYWSWFLAGNSGIKIYKFINSSSAIKIFARFSNNGGAAITNMKRLITDKLVESQRITETYAKAIPSNVSVDDWFTMMNVATDYSSESEARVLDLGFDTKPGVIRKIEQAQGGLAAIQAFYDKNWKLSPAPSAFTFPIGSDTYSCDFGMTWATWVASAYNTAGFTVSNNKVYDANNQAVQKNGTDVADTDMVRYGDSYTLASSVQTISFSISDPYGLYVTSYQADVGMTWAQWVTSAYNTDGYVDHTINITNSNSTKEIKDGGVIVQSSDVIVANKTYTAQSTGSND